MPRKPRKLELAFEEIDRRLSADELLSADEKEIIRKRAREEVSRRRRDDAEKRFLELAIAEEERSYNPQEVWEDVVIDLAPYCAFIALDGVQYFHGLTYTVTHAQVLTIIDICARTWEHQREIKGERRRGSDVAWEGRSQRPVSINPSNAGSTPEMLNSARGAVSTRENLLRDVRI